MVRRVSSSPRRKHGAIRLGVFSAPATPAANPRWGATVACEAFVEALLRHGAAESIDVVVQPRHLDVVSAAASKVLLARSGRARPRVEVLPRAPDALRERPITAWHDPRGHVFPCLALRRLRDGRYPVTVLHHAVSYQQYVHALFVRYLIADLRPYDSLVCATPTTRTAIQNMLEHARAALRRLTGADLPVRARLDVLPLGIDTDFFCPRPQAETRAALSLPRDAFILLWLARLSAHDKADPLALLAVFRRLVSRCRDRELLLVLAGHPGQVNEVAAIQRYCRELGLQDRVRLMPDTTDRHLIFAAADAFVSPVDNIQETFGLTPIEAMACGVPQVVSDWDGYRHTVVHGVTGFLVPTRWTRCDEDAAELAVLEVDALADQLALGQSVAVDPEALEADLAQLIDNPRLRAAMSRASRKHAVATYDWRPVLRQYEALWRELQEIARRDRGAPPPAPWLDLPPYFDAYRGLATSCLEDDAVLVSTPAGEAALQGAEPWPACPQRTGVVDEALARALLDELAAGRGRSLARLVRAFAEYRPARVRRHAMWLLKYGFAALGAREPGA
jgi:D-inositol-3-phosphate glycosyltransferase